MESSMEPEPRKCDADLGDGKRCQEMAMVLGIHYHYGTRPGVATPTVHYLRETHYQIRCPKCGERTQIVKASQS